MPGTQQIATTTATLHVYFPRLNLRFSDENSPVSILRAQGKKRGNESYQALPCTKNLSFKEFKIENARVNESWRFGRIVGGKVAFWLMHQ